MKCDYGCGRDGVYKLKNGKICCSEKWQSCPSAKERYVSKRSNKPLSESHKKSISNALKGKERSENHCKKISEALKGKKQSDEVIEKRRRSNIRFLEGLSKEERKEKYGRYRSIKLLKKKHPTFCLVEEIRYKPGSTVIQVHCKNHNCENSKEKGGWFTPTSRQIENRLRDIECGNGGSYFYCSKDCKQQCPLFGLRPDHEVNRSYSSTEWYTPQEYEMFRQEVLKRQRDDIGHNECEICGCKEDLHVHHEKTKKTSPHMSLDPDNGIILCGRSANGCHYIYGHSDDCNTGRIASIICTETN